MRIYPVEVEAYYRYIGFNDEFVHGNELQKNNYGKFYIHHAGKTGVKEAKYKAGTRKGIDICLSNSDDFYYGVLIRSAKFNLENIVFGPNNVCEFIKESNSLVSKLEEDAVLKTAINECRDNLIILHSTRVGLGSSGDTEY